MLFRSLLFLGRIILRISMAAKNAKTEPLGVSHGKCEAAGQLNLFACNDLQPSHMPRRNGLTSVELFNEAMPNFAATLAANHPDANVNNDDRVLETA